MLRETVSSFAREVIAPRVRKMDEEGRLDPLLLQQLFNQGLMVRHSGGNGAVGRLQVIRATDMR